MLRNRNNNYLIVPIFAWADEEWEQYLNYRDRFILFQKIMGTILN